MNEQDDDKPPGKLDKKKLLIRIRERCKLMMEADHENRESAKEDIKFVSIPGEQWDPLVKAARGSRACYEFDKLSIKGQRLINEMRANRPSGKVRAVEDSDKATATVREGLCRNIANVSDLDTICDYAGVYQVEGGMGAWRVTTEYAKNSRKKQRIRAERIPNPFCLYWDPSSTDPLKRDAADWCLLDTLSGAKYTAKYGKVPKISFSEGECEDDPQWEDKENVRVCEYWYKETYKKTILLLKDGREIDAQSRAAQSIDPSLIQSSEEIDCDRIMMCIASGEAILEGPTKQAGTQHRFVVVHGAWKIVDGKPMWWGLVRKAKDAQRRYNVTQTAVTEAIAGAPNSQFWATVKQAEGNTALWNRAQTENLPFMLYTPDPLSPGPPERMAPAPIPAALITEAQIADQELKDVTGVYDASLGERSNEKSGIAISRREQQTQLVNFNFPDNMAKGVQRTWEIFNDLIPEIIDTEQMIRVLGHDGAEEYIRVNEAGTDPETGLPAILNDLTTGEFDITVTVGPSFATQRQEATETLTQMIQAFPPIMQFAPDLVFKGMDLIYSDEMAERMRVMLPPQIQEMLNKDKKQPPEVMQAMQQVKQMQEMVTQQGQMVQAAAAEATQMKNEAEKAQSGVQTAISQLKVEQANFEASVAKEIANIATKQAALATAEANLVKQAAEDQAQGVEEAGAQVEQARQGLEQGQSEAVASIQQMAEQFMQLAANVIAGIDQRTQVQSAPKPRVKMIQRGPNGSLVPVYDQPGPDQVTSISRNPDGSLVPEYASNGSQPPSSLTGTVQ